MPAPSLLYQSQRPPEIGKTDTWQTVPDVKAKDSRYPLLVVSAVFRSIRLITLSGAVMLRRTR
jgi:hypothetical protein